MTLLSETRDYYRFLATVPANPALVLGRSFVKLIAMPGTEVELDGLKEKLLLMASHAEAAVNRAIRAMLRRDDDLARRTREEDSIIDTLELEIDHCVVDLLSRRPSPLDLRLLTSIMKIARELERVGDEATTISRRCLELSHEPPLKFRVDIAGIATLSLEMLKEALDAFVHEDPAKARRLIPKDEEVDRLHRDLQRELLGHMSRQPETITRSLHLIVIAKSLERIGDHATNLAEMVVYLFEGADIRHAATKAL
ncbi:MAG: phosphate signaling complex protein PhoU [Verrucomicrobia subdivision 3 bacterium]|nr:phosphate signaling complex protein PhoU [Limisphaerales bacterium]